MLIWNGHGILIPLLFVGSVILGMVFGEDLGLTVYQTIGGSITLAAVLVLLYGRTIGKTKVDTETGSKKRHSFFFITGTFWGIILLGIGGTILYSSWGEDLEAMEAAKSPEQRAFEAANDRLRDYDVASGNSAEAEALAARFSETMKEVRDLAIRKESSPDKQIKGGDFRTYCQLSDGKLAFLVRVPDLKKYTDDAKDFIIEIAWSAAQGVAADLPSPPTKIGVATRGSIFYDQAWAGSFSVDSSAADPDVKKKTIIPSQELMYSFFADESAAAVETETNLEESVAEPDVTEPAPEN